MPSRVLDDGRAEGARKASAPGPARDQSPQKELLQRKGKAMAEMRPAGCCVKKVGAFCSEDAKADQHPTGGRQSS